LRAGATVGVTGCVPDCGAEDAWALLGTDGAVRLSTLRPVTGAETATPTPGAEQLWYGRVSGISQRIYREPELHSPRLDRRHVPHEMAFLEDEGLRARGWLQRAEGGYVQIKGVTFLPVSPFTGQSSPTLPLVFILKPLRARASDPPASQILQRYDRVPLLGLDGSGIITAAGTFPRGSATVIALQQRPVGIPGGAKWVSIDLAAQTLTAYEGDKPVYATLVSSGKRQHGHRTLPGLYRVQHKLIYSDMHGGPAEPYTVDRVPYTQYFDKSEGLHGTYWHDGFGARASHGCVNLSMADAKWLFDWSPPPLPAQWNSIDPVTAGLTTLWVLVLKS
jgi:hypothetical protein